MSSYNPPSPERQAAARELWAKIEARREAYRATLPAGTVNRDVRCPFSADMVCRSGCPTQRDRACINGIDEED